jgi:hypothetical protein
VCSSLSIPPRELPSADLFAVAGVVSDTLAVEPEERFRQRVVSSVLESGTPTVSDVANRTGFGEAGRYVFAREVLRAAADQTGA